MKQKRIVTIQDISCFGKCSLSVAMPIISAFGIETVVLPTALLSTHTGAGFKDYTFLDLTGEMKKIIEHWEKMNLEFDAVYSGYFGNKAQIETAVNLFKYVKKSGSPIIIDPVMADDGNLYAGFDSEFVKKMYSLCSIADVITPNVTEAAYLTGIEYRGQHDEQYIHDLAIRLSETGAKLVVITGISHNGKSGAVCYNSENGEFVSHLRQHIPGNYYGTGDIFASTLCGAIVSGADFRDALSLAVDFVHESIENTLDEPDKYFYGVKFEQSLNMITGKLKRFSESLAEHTP